MSADTKIASRDAGRKTVVDIDAQNVDFRNGDLIKSTISNLVSKGQKHIVLNLAKVSFMDSSGLGVILFCKRACDDAEGSFGICGLQHYVNNLVTLTNLNRAVEIYPSETEAL